MADFCEDCSYELEDTFDLDDDDLEYRTKLNTLKKLLRENYNANIVNKFYEVKEILEIARKQRDEDLLNADNLRKEEISLIKRFIDSSLHEFNKSEEFIIAESNDILNKMQNLI